jgi:hypothetical protein
MTPSLNFQPSQRFGRGRKTVFFALPVGQSCRSALNFWAAQQRRPTDGAKDFVLRPDNFIPSTPNFDGLIQRISVV